VIWVPYYQVLSNGHEIMNSFTVVHHFILFIGEDSCIGCAWVINCLQILRHTHNNVVYRVNRIPDIAPYKKEFDIISNSQSSRQSMQLSSILFVG
jgi:hypothetical protein